MEAAITRYADGKTTVKMSAVSRAVHTAVPGIRSGPAQSERVGVNNGVVLYVISTLRRLGLAPSPSWLEFHRTEPDLITRATEDQQATAKPARIRASSARRRWRRPRPTPLSPVDWVEVEAAITRYADGKTTVEMSAVLRAVHTAVPAIEADWPESERVEVNNGVVLLRHQRAASPWVNPESLMAGVPPHRARRDRASTRQARSRADTAIPSVLWPAQW